MNQYDNTEFFNEYSKMSRSQFGLQGAGEWHQFEPMFPTLKGKTVLDLGCGYGWHCKFAVEKGALKVVGIDKSEKMINEAKIRNQDKKIEYKICGIAEYDYPENKYDVVISNLALHYIEDLEDVYKKVYKALKEDGEFIFNIEHPTFTAGVNQEFIAENGKNLYWPIDNYYYPGIRKTTFLGFEVLKYHHTLTQILNGLIKTGFCIEAVEEAMPSEEMRNEPFMKDEMRRPMMLLVKAKK